MNTRTARKYQTSSSIGLPMKPIEHLALPGHLSATLFKVKNLFTGVTASYTLRKPGDESGPCFPTQKAAHYAYLNDPGWR